MEFVAGFCRILLVVLLWHCPAYAQRKSAVSTPKVVSCGVGKECVPRHLCSSNDTIIKDGVALINFRTLNFSPTENFGCAWSQKCCSLSDKKQEEHVPYVSRGCGYTNPQGLGINIRNAPNGESQFGEFPWMVGILSVVTIGDSVQYISRGGGSLLSPKVVLTTAHNIFSDLPSSLTIRAGEWDNKYDTEPLPHVDHSVKSVVIHEHFDSRNGIYDVALLILDNPIKFDKHIDTICLPTENSYFHSSRCLVMGWGKKEANVNAYPQILKKIDLPLIRHGRCQELLRNTRLGHNFELHDSFACAGGEKNKDACLGDGGAPLVCPMSQTPNRYQVVGLVSWGLSCGIENIPGVYADVMYLKPWIMEKLTEYS